MKFIALPNVPAPLGHYSPGVQVGGLLFISGQLPIDAATGKFVAGTIEEEALRTLNNMRAVVEAAGGKLTDIAKVTIYVADVADWPKVNAVYAQFFGTHKPARAVIPCGGLHYGAKLEIEGVAELSRK
ncbi:RidA family protein [Oleiharenicola lentus]|uniref:RidA family protein n=1 Tax=Oleiharenicola lentus TaxID=2508720 RepID=UPI003F674D39